MRNPPRPWFGATVTVVSPPWQGGPVPSQAEGAERRVAPSELHALRGVPADVRVPLAKGTRRPSALRAALVGHRGRAPVAGAFPAFALGVAVIR